LASQETSRLLPRVGDLQTLQKVVYDTLRDQILSLALRPGERLVESRIAEELGVSKTPVREVFQRLEADGLVILYPRRGATVTPLTHENLEQLLFIRVAIEMQIGSQLASLLQEEHLEALERAVEEMAVAVESGDQEACEDAHRGFHEIELSVLGYPMVADLVRDLTERMRRYHRLEMASGHWAREVKYHRQLLCAFREADESRIREITERSGWAFLESFDSAEMETR